MSAQTLLAQVDLGEAYRLSPEGKPVAEVYSSPAALINTLMPNLFMLAGVLLFFFVFFAGFRMLTNPGDSKKMEEGKKSLGYAIGGFLLLFAAYWIMQIVKALTGIDVLGG